MPPPRPQPPTGDKRVAFVVGDANNFGRGDDDLLTFIESLNFVVDIVDDTDRSRDFRDAGLVVISSSVNENNVRDEWANVAQPVLVMKSALFPDMFMTDNGNQSEGTQNARDIQIVDSMHPMAAGLSGRVTISRNNNAQLNFGSPGPEADIIARVGNDPRRAVIFAYEAGAQLIGDGGNRNNNRNGNNTGAGGTATGRTARHRRVGFFLNEQDTNNLDSDGELLLEAALTWAWSGEAVAAH
jgi:hypothetical protein